MKRIFRLPVFAGAFVIAAVLTSLVPTSSSRVFAQFVRLGYSGNSYYSPYGQSLYGHYGQRYGAYDTLGRTNYGYSAYGLTPYRYGSTSRYSYGNSNQFTYGRSPYVRSYGGSTYYQPFYGGSNYYRPYNSGIYFGFGGY